MRKWVLPLLVILSILLPIRVHAQNPLSLSSMVIEIWPEYDKPSVLVIYQMTLSSSTSYPATMSVRIPASAGEPNAVAERQSDGSLYTITYTRQVDGEWATINFTTTISEVQIEYYDQGLSKDGNARHYQYIWSGDYAIAQLTIQVQQPSGATDMRIAPSLGAGVAGTDNLTYFTQDVGAITAGQNIQISIDYQKTTEGLSVDSLPLAPSAPIPQSTATDLNISTWLPWILGILGAGLIIGGIVWYWQTGRQRPAPQTRRSRSKARLNEPVVNSGTDEAEVYCSQCGKRASPGDQFCRSCGTPIRSR
ncbi:MAG: hypothetical protein A2Z71_11820 [Chloroflexi bacterium RBG_13_50_21]|nr:MAG: hypothetical protein A2Z71_11820 [Chloroflexi bacterium RBG_13_50_21]